MGPARISTWVMVALLLIGATYPSYIIYKKLYRCLIRCKEPGNNAAVPVRNDSVEANIPTERIEFCRENTEEKRSKWSPEGGDQDQRDSRILAAIEELKIKYKREKEKDSIINNTNVSKEE